MILFIFIEIEIKGFWGFGGSLSQWLWARFILNSTTHRSAWRYNLGRKSHPTRSNLWLPFTDFALFLALYPKLNVRLNAFR